MKVEESTHCCGFLPRAALTLTALLASSLTMVAGCALGQSSPEQGVETTSAPAKAGPPQYLPITAQWCLKSSDCIQLEVPSGTREFSLGMQMRPALPPLRGMWFAFKPPAPARFWMHRTPEPLDMIFVRDGRVVVIESDIPPCMNLPCPSYGTGDLVDGVVEVGAGQAEALGIGVGTAVTIQPIKAVSPAAPARD